MNLVLYTKNNCIQCKMTKRFLEQNNITFEEHNISEEPEYVDYLKEKGFQTVFQHTGAYGQTLTESRRSSWELKTSISAM